MGMLARALLSRNIVTLISVLDQKFPMIDKKSSRSRLRWYLYGIVVLGVAAAVWYFAFGTTPEKKRYPQPAWAGTGYPSLVPVRTVAAQLQDLPVHLKAIGTVIPFNTVTVKSRVDGQLLRVVFEEGQRVDQGEEVGSGREVADD